jgi:TRAP-type mannitol/chloroaromatic compound transport system substrate-binding protein
MSLCKGLQLAAATVALGALLLAPAGAEAQKRVKWKVAGSYATSLDVLGPNGKRVTELITQMSDGKFEVKFFEPGALVPALEVFDAVSKGSVEAAYTSSGFHAGKIPAAAFFGSVPFGPNAGEYLAWLRYGGGNEIYRELYAAHNLIPFQCGIVVAEASGWFRKPINSADDLKGLKMRFFGLGAKVMQKMGVSTQLLAPADIYPALERGVIDATELSFPSIDLNYGYYQVAKHYYFPGWHQQSSMIEFLANLGLYNDLPDSYKTIILGACSEGMIETMAQGESKQAKALKEIAAKGVTIHRWPDSFLKQLEDKWNEVIAEESAKDPLFKRIHDSYAGFRKEFAVWKDHGYLK